MITFLEGTLVEKSPTRAVLDVGGVGYEVSIPLSSFDHLPDEGKLCRILTVDYIREDQHALFGFISATERQLFNLLMTVTGIGPKLAISVLSSMSPPDVQLAILDRDVKRLCSISGIGRKTAERIIVDLRDKISASEAAVAAAGKTQSPADKRARDAVLALISLGYKQADAQKKVIEVVAREPGITSVEEIVRKTLSPA